MEKGADILVSFPVDSIFQYYLCFLLETFQEWPYPERIGRPRSCTLRNRTQRRTRQHLSSFFLVGRRRRNRIKGVACAYSVSHSYLLACIEGFKTHFQRDKQTSIKQKIYIYCGAKSESLYRGDSNEDCVFREMFGI